MTFIKELESPQLVIDLQEIKNQLEQLLSTNNSPYSSSFWHQDNAANFLMDVMNELERLFFMDSSEYPSGSFEVHRDYYFFGSYINNTGVSTGFVLGTGPATEWIDAAAYEHLEVIEKSLQKQNQFLKVFTCNNKLCVYTNKKMDWEQIAKLKIMQWTIFEDKIETPEPAVLEFLNALIKKDKDKANEAINKIINREDLQNKKYEEILKVFQNPSKRIIETMEENLQTWAIKITTLENQLSEALIRHREVDERLKTMLMAPQSDYKYMIKYLKNHPYIQKITVINDNTLSLYYEAPIIYYDKYILRKIKERADYKIDKKIYQIFEDEEFELVTRCQIEFNTNSFSVHLCKIGDNVLIGHPHIDKFSCFGTHNRAIQDAAASGEYLGALEQITQAVLNLNFSDSYVTRELLKTLKRHPKSLITWRNKETGVLLSTEEVLDQYEETQTNNTGGTESDTVNDQ